jgi:hypothetical protein
MFIGELCLFPLPLWERVRERGLVSSFDPETRVSKLSEAKSMGRASSPINELRKDFLQKRYNFGGDSDRRHVSRGLNWSVPLQRDRSYKKNRTLMVMRIGNMFIGEMVVSLSPFMVSGAEPWGRGLG